MPIISRIIGERPKIIIIHMNNVITGELMTTFKITKKAATRVRLAQNHMDGRNQSTTPLFTRQRSAQNLTAKLNLHLVANIIVRKTKGLSTC
jgi:hypothetical protein